jgi:hypothetical protein
MTTKHCSLFMLGLVLLGGCTEEPPPRSVSEFEANPILLEAAVIRCAQNRSESRYDAECMNAREAVSRIEAREEAARRAELEARSESKRRALRRTQQAAAEARRRAQDLERQRREAEYLAQFGELPPDDVASEGASTETTNTPGAVIPEAVDESAEGGYRSETLPAADGGNAPVMETAPETEAPSDLESIRDELRRRNEDSGN